MSSILATNIIQNAFSPLISVFKAIMVLIHDNVTGGSWGLAIIGLTLVVRAALVPLTVKQFSSMAKMQVLGPEIKALRERYKDDKQRLNEETMKFYRENQVNPFGSCLPIVLQAPVFISLFYMLRSDLKLQICGHALKAHHIVTDAMIQKTSCQSVAHGSGKFLFIPDITAKASGVVLIVLIILYIGSQLVASLLTTATVDRNQRLLMLGLPFVFTFFIISFPAGLIVYWITTNLWTVGQQAVVRRYFPSPALAGASDGDGGKLSLSKLWTRGGEGDGNLVSSADTEPNGGSGARGAAAKAGTIAGKDVAPGSGRAKKHESAGAGTPTAVARRKGGSGPGTGLNGTSAGGKKEGQTNGGRAAKSPASPRPKASAPPPPPRKKKKRSGRRR